MKKWWILRHNSDSIGCSDSVLSNSSNLFRNGCRMQIFVQIRKNWKKVKVSNFSWQSCSIFPPNDPPWFPFHVTMSRSAKFGSNFMFFVFYECTTHLSPNDSSRIKIILFSLCKMLYLIIIAWYRLMIHSFEIQLWFNLLFSTEILLT